MNTITVLYIDCQIIIKKLIIPRNKTGLLSGPVLREYEIDTLNNESYDSVQSVSIYKVVADHTHPLFSRITMNSCKTSTQAATTFRPEKARTQKRAKSFFQFYMRFSNNGNIYIE